ncbi:unnamed protein product [Ambrosiozyma monospora]|uniref:Unnamed protein product n=1 Tax=Ambrosiozyma monospora TaxID=43982 RepID=A0ACB5T301_AMBMO|nr:unnamed protein product [Ambrosiozyma monospora]
MLGNLFSENGVPNDNFDNLFKAIGDFIEANKYGSFKVVDLWNFLKTHKLNKLQFDIPTIMNSWIRLPGFPIVQVSEVSKDGEITLTQNRVLRVKDDTIENVPFQIPLFVHLANGKIGKQLLNDRTLKIVAGDAEPYLTFNANNTVIATVQYTLAQYQTIAANFTKLSAIEQCQVLIDISSILGSQYQTNDDIIGFFTIMATIAPDCKKICIEALNLSVTILNNITKSNLTVAYKQDPTLFAKLTQWNTNLATVLISQFDWSGDKTNYAAMSTAELNARTQILSLDYTNAHSLAICKTLYKNLIHGPKSSVPKRFLPPVLSTIQANASVKDYKEISKLIKNPGLIVANVIEPNSQPDIQTSAIGSLGFVTSRELRNKTLNYVQTNLDVKMVELALLGFKFQGECAELVFNWFKLHFKELYGRVLRDNRKGEDSFIRFFQHLVELVCELCLAFGGALVGKLEKFLKEKDLEILNDLYERANVVFDGKVRLSSEDKALLKVFNESKF